MLPLILDTACNPAGSDLETVHDILETAQRFLGMDVAFVAAQVDANASMKYQAVVGQAKTGTMDHAMALADQYCQQIGKGNLPPAINDSLGMPVLKNTGFTQDNMIRALICVPLYDEDQKPTGLICGFSDTVKPDMEQRDLKVLSMLSRVASSVLNRHLTAQKARQDAAINVLGVINTQDFEVFLQPIVSLSDNRPMAVEALCRFSTPEQRSTFNWFELAAQADLSQDLELAAIKKALGYLPDLPDGMYAERRARHAGRYASS